MMKNQNDEVCISNQCHKNEKEKYLYEKPKLGTMNLLADNVLNSPCLTFVNGCDAPYQASMN